MLYGVSITSAPSIASLIASIVLPVLHSISRCGLCQCPVVYSHTRSAESGTGMPTFHVRQVKPSDVAAVDQ
jgi:hypothetical protein